MLTSTPTPTIQPTAAAKPQQPQSSYRAQKEQTRLAGRITSRGISSVNAVGTPLGVTKKFFCRHRSRWYPSVETQRDLINIGTARVVFSVDRAVT